MGGGEYNPDRNSTNPYTTFQVFMVDQLYIKLTNGWQGRFLILCLLLIYMIFISIVYLCVTYKRQKSLGKQVWLWRVVRRPQGRYIVCNQYYYYPVGCIVMAAVWLEYVKVLWVNFNVNTSARQIFFWTALAHIPAFTHAYTTTYAVLGGANLASSRRNQLSRHVLNPWIQNSFILILLPAMVAAMFYYGVRTGIIFRKEDEGWEAIYQSAGEKASAFNPTNLTTFDIDQLIGLQQQAYFNAILPGYLQLQAISRKSTITSIGAAAILLFVHMGGAIFLLSNLRRTNNDQLVTGPVVAPLGPLVTTAKFDASVDSLPNSIEKGELPIDRKTADNDYYEDPHTAEVESNEGPVRGKRLSWDITLFFAGVGPICVLYIGFGTWLISSFRTAFQVRGLFEFSVLAVPWLFSGVASVSMTALSIKGVIDMRNHKRHAQLLATGIGGEEKGVPSAHLRARLEQMREKQNRRGSSGS